MSDTNKIADVLQRVERMLDALAAHTQSSADFKAACDSLQRYLGDHAKVFVDSGTLSNDDKNRVAKIIERLTRFQRSAENKGSIPNELQKYIAERLD